MATLTVKQSGGDYSSLNAALLACSDGDIISIEGEWTVADTTACTIAATSITIQIGDSLSAHPGHWDTSQNHYRLVVSSGAAITITGGIPIIDGLAIGQNGSGNGITIVKSSNFWFKNLLLKCTGPSGTQDGIYFSYSHNQIVYVNNCVVEGFYRGGLRFSQHGDKTNGSTECYINSSFFIGNGKGIACYSNASGLKPVTFGVHNTISVDNTISDITQTNTLSTASRVDNATTLFSVSYSIDSDGSIGSTGVVDNVGNLNNRSLTDNVSPGPGDWVVVENITTPQYSYKLKQSPDNDAEDVHAVATAEGSTISATDIIGTSRPNNTNYDIGPFEVIYVAADNLTPLGIIAGPRVGVSALGQNHSLTPTGIRAFPLWLTPPALGQNHLLFTTGLKANPRVGVPQLGQNHILASASVFATPKVDSISMGQIHALSGSGIVMVSTVGVSTVGSIFHLTPAGIVMTPILGKSAILTILEGFVDVEIGYRYLDVIFDSDLLN